MDNNTTNVVADPARPWKAVVAAIIAGAGVALAQGQDLLPPWVMLILAVIVGGLGTFLVPNPMVVDN